MAPEASPLRRRVFRALLFATLVSNVGGWMEDVGESWLMTTLHGTPLMVALVQGSASLPVFLFALPAGTLADIVDRRRLLLVSQAWMLAIAAFLAALTFGGHVGPWGLLACTFAMGLGAALGGPASQAVIADIVPRREVPRAAVLNGVALNVGRVAGPALGGIVVAWAGAGATFLFNALSFVAVIVVLVRWKRTHVVSLLPTERLWNGVRSGLRYAREAPTLRVLIVRTFAVLVSASALWALLPSFVRLSLGGSSFHYGLLLAALGMGAVASAPLVGHMRERFGVDTVLIPATCLLAAGIGGLAVAPSIGWAAAATFVSGAAWLTILSISSAAAQKASAEWVQARVLAIYLLTAEAAMAIGSVAWGWLATRASVRIALGTAAVGVAASVLVATRRRLGDLDRIDRSPALAVSLTIPEAPAGIDRDDTPVVVEVEYRVGPLQRAAFRKALEAVGRTRRRTGAILWILTTDSEDASRFVEVFVLESWNEHHRQHARWTQHDADLWAYACSLVQPGSAPKIAHLLDASVTPRRRRLWRMRALRSHERG